MEEGSGPDVAGHLPAALGMGNEEVSRPDVACQHGPAHEPVRCLGPEALVRPGGGNQCLVPGNAAGPTHCSRDFIGPSDSKTGLDEGQGVPS